MTKASLTFYNDEEDEYGQITAKPNSKGYFLAVSGETIAVDPKVIPYYSRVHIPALEEIATDPDSIFFAHDTGSAVKARIASIARGNDYPVIDVFMKVSKRQLLKLNDKFGNEVEYEII